jgi:death on curing protein
LYPDLFSKAAALFESLVSNHPFLDGNKRTAITAAGLFLRLNGARLSTTQSELERFTLRAAQGIIGLDESKAWFEENSRVEGAQSI